MDVVAVERDIDRSGRRLERAGLDRVFAAAAAGEVDAVVVLYVTRIGRNLEQSVQIARQLRDAGVALYSVNEDIDQATTAGRLTFHVMASVAEAESDRLKEQWAVARARAAGRGVYLGRVPFGYAKDPATRFLAPHPEHADVVEDLYDRRARGDTLGELAPLLDRHAPLASGEPHGRARVAEIIRAERYRGASPNLPRLVSDAQWYAAQAPAPKVRPSVTGHDYILTGIARCGSCGGSMAAGGTHELPVYKCSTRRTRGKRSCSGGATITADRLEAWVLDLVGRGADAWQAQIHQSADADQVAELQAQHAAAELALAGYLADTQTKAQVPERIWRGELEHRIAEEERARRAAAVAERALRSAGPPKTWEQVLADPVRLRSALRGRIKALVVHQGRGKTVDERCELVLFAD